MEGINPRTMSDDVLLERCVDAIRWAARGEANGGDERSYRFAMQLLEESTRRQVAAGHTRRCGGGIYQQAYERATAEHAGREPQEVSCDCGGAA